MAAYKFNVDAHEFDGRRVLLTGGTKGIGQAVAARLREGGARVLTTARERANDLADIDLFVATDITTSEGCAAIADATLKRLEGIRVVRVSPGWVETEAAVGLVNELAANRGTD